MRIRNLAVAALGVAALCGASGCRKHARTAKVDPLLAAYDSEADWNDSTKMIPLGYQQAQGKRVFYQYCVWCHADSRSEETRLNSSHSQISYAVFCLKK